MYQVSNETAKELGLPMERKKKKYKSYKRGGHNRTRNKIKDNPEKQE